jgi:hypothetical protein
MAAGSFLSESKGPPGESLIRKKVIVTTHSNTTGSEARRRSMVPKRMKFET